jgi:hypothetical protein
MNSDEYRVLQITGYVKGNSDSPIYNDRLAVPKDCPVWLEDLACFGLAYSKANLNNVDHYLFKTFYDEKQEKWFGAYLGHEPPSGCGCGGK